MLILTRKVGETIHIGDEVTVRVLGVRGGQVSLGFTAPGDVRIFREEVLLDGRSTGAAAPTGTRPTERCESAAGPRPPAKLRPARGGARKVASRSA